MTSPKYFRVTRTHLTCLNGTVACFTTVVVTHTVVVSDGNIILKVIVKKRNARACTG